MDNKAKMDVIVVGAGPAGVSAAITIARAGKNVILIERGNYAGAKNMFGGAIYLKPAAEIFPNILKDAPLERIITEHRWGLLTDTESTLMCFKSADKNNSASVLRVKFDKWMVEEAIKAGVYYAPKTLVKSLITENGAVVGIRTTNEDFYAPLTIIADGVNSILATQIGLRKKLNPKHMALGVKEVIKLGREKIEERFNLKSEEGCFYELFGGPLKDTLAMSFIYTDKEHISIGIGLGLSGLKETGLKPYEVLDKLKAHPLVEPLIRGGELVEYSAHLIPEGGYFDIPKLYTNGALVIGDAASLVNNVHLEGTNIAMLSGKFAGETAVVAVNNKDYSEQTLKLYHDKLSDSFIIKDLKSYRHVMNEALNRLDSFFNYYPKKIAEFFNLFINVDSIPKKEKYKKFIFNTFKTRKFNEFWCDLKSMLKIILGVFK